MAGKIGIIDYGMGNLRSVQKSVERLGVSCQILTRPEEVRVADRLILPGVGAFEDAIAALKNGGLVEPLLEKIHAGTPFLGICLGMQLLFERSLENGEFRGLGLFQGDVVRFQFTEERRKNAGEKLSIPHMGWNQISLKQPEHPLWKGVTGESFYYFVHSYHVVPKDVSIIATTTFYGYEFCSAVCSGNVMATQFHPEKSQEAGSKLLENFMRL